MGFNQSNDNDNNNMSTSMQLRTILGDDDRDREKSRFRLLLGKSCWPRRRIIRGDDRDDGRTTSKGILGTFLGSVGFGRFSTTTTTTSEQTERQMKNVFPFICLFVYHLVCSLLFYTLQYVMVTHEAIGDGYGDGDDGETWEDGGGGLDGDGDDSFHRQKNETSRYYRHLNPAAGAHLYSTLTTTINQTKSSMKTKYYGVGFENCADLCGDNASFGKAFYFTSTVFFSIGYGDVVPCMWYGKLITIIVASTGVPLTLFCLSRLGRPMKSVMEFLWYNYLSVWKGEEDVAKERWALPLPVGISLTLVWILLSSIFFKSTIINLRGGVVDLSTTDDSKDGPTADDTHIHFAGGGGGEVTYLDAVYFTVISLFTIGFGDFAPPATDNRLNWLTFSFVFIGLAMVSMCVAIAQRNMEQKFNSIRLRSLLQQCRFNSNSNGRNQTSDNEDQLLQNLTPDQTRILAKVLQTWTSQKSFRPSPPKVDNDGNKGINLSSLSGRVKMVAEAEQRATPQKVLFGSLAQGAVISRWRFKTRFKPIGTQCNLVECEPLRKLPAAAAAATSETAVLWSSETASKSSVICHDETISKDWSKIDTVNNPEKMTMPSANLDGSFGNINVIDARRQQQQQQRQQSDESFNGNNSGKPPAVAAAPVAVIPLSHRNRTFLPKKVKSHPATQPLTPTESFNNIPLAPQNSEPAPLTLAVHLLHNNV